MEAEPPTGTQRTIDGVPRVYYYGYWIKAYDVPADTLLAKKRLIEALTRRLFNHVEHGINVPGTRLDEARAAYDRETVPARKRVKGAMLAGALFNRAADVFTKLVELQAIGVHIHHDDALMRQCGDHLEEALALGKMVLHRSGEEGIDELWGEPFKAFAFSIEDFYVSRYVKIAQTMRAIDQIRDTLSAAFAGLAAFEGSVPLLRDFTVAAKSKCETLRTDVDHFEVWTSFVVSAEELTAFVPALPESAPAAEVRIAAEGVDLIRRGVELVGNTARARVPMPKSAADLVERCESFRGYAALLARPARSVA